MFKKKFLFVCSLAFCASLCACGSTGGNEKSSEGPKEKTFAATINVDEVPAEFETHTETQLSYINEKDFTKLPSAANGRNENSNPNSLSFNWSLESEETIDAVKFEIGEKEDMSDAMVYTMDKDSDGAFEHSKTLTNFKVGKTYYYRVSAISGDAFARSEVASFKTNDNAPRFITIDGVKNVRDVGGWHTEDGKRIKQGLLIRGGEFNKQNNTNYDKDDAVERAKEKPYGRNITTKGIDTVLNELKIKTEVDVRGYEQYEYIDQSSEYYLKPNPKEIGGLTDGHGVIEELNYVVNPIHTNGTKIYKDDYGKAAVKKFFSMLADESCLPIYYHCYQGKDRTGFLGYVFEAFLGVSRENCLRDYLYSNFGSSGSVKIGYILNESDPSAKGSQYDYVAYFDGYKVEGMDQLTETTLPARVESYLLSTGLTAEQLNNIRTNFLED